MKKFTQEVKDNWLAALKSGDYVQGRNTLKTHSGHYCCIGVLGNIMEGFSDNNEDLLKNTGECPYEFLRQNRIAVSNLTKENDRKSYWDNNPPKDYSNVIPLIENLKVII